MRINFGVQSAMLSVMNKVSRGLNLGRQGNFVIDMVRNEDWDEFESQLLAWNHPSQTEPLELNYTFNLDRLPVAFATALPKKDDSTYERKPLNDAIRGLANEIWKIGGFRFRLRRTHWDEFKFDYICCQDIDHAKASVAKGKQDSPRMERFKCGSKLILKPSIERRTMQINIHHRYHVPYFHRQKQVVRILTRAPSSSGKLGR